MPKKYTYDKEGLGIAYDFFFSRHGQGGQGRSGEFKRSTKNTYKWDLSQKMILGKGFYQRDRTSSIDR